MFAPKTAWPHALTHRLAEAGTFMVTAGAYHNAHHFRDAVRLDVLQRGLLKLMRDSGWHLEAWAIFSNHYHFVAHSPATLADSSTLSTILSELHKKTSTWINRLDRNTGRKVWHNFWDTRLSHQTSYFARLNYVHQNAVRHDLVKVANQYPWCSAGWFEQNSSAAPVKTVYRFGCIRINVTDDFAPVLVG